MLLIYGCFFLDEVGGSDVDKFLVISRKMGFSAYRILVKFGSPSADNIEYMNARHRLQTLRRTIR